MKKKVSYCANGHFFKTQKEAEEYVNKLGLRIANTETLKVKTGMIHLFTLAQ